MILVDNVKLYTGEHSFPDGAVLVEGEKILYAGSRAACPKAEQARRIDGRGGILGSHIPFGDTRRGWNFVSPGHGDVDFDGIIRELNQMGYHGPLCVEWEDSGMERMFGAREAFQLVERINFEPSAFSFDAALKSHD